LLELYPPLEFTELGANKGACTTPSSSSDGTTHDEETMIRTPESTVTKRVKDQQSNEPVCYVPFRSAQLVAAAGNNDNKLD
jgi:hypothetical protein